MRGPLRRLHAAAVLHALLAAAPASAQLPVQETPLEEFQLPAC